MKKKSIAITLIITIVALSGLYSVSASEGQSTEQDLVLTTVTGSQTTKVFLPLILKNFPKTLNGTVTDKGIPVAGTQILLRYYNGSTWSTYSSTLTDSYGKYQFRTLPTLSAGHKYRVRWKNTVANSNLLWVWYCDDINSSTIYPNAYQCDFDIENIELISPGSGLTISLPYTFSWKKRTLTSDDYEFNLEDMSDYDPWWWTDPPLGYVSSYNLNSLPSGFTPGVQYGWYVAVYGSNGKGFPYIWHRIIFSNTGGQIGVDPIPLNEIHQKYDESVYGLIEEDSIKIDNSSK